VDVVFVARHDVLLVNLVASESGHTAGTDMGRSELPSAKESLLRRGTTACLGRGIRQAQRKSLRRAAGRERSLRLHDGRVDCDQKGDRASAQKVCRTSRPGRKSTARVVNDCRRREDMGPSILCFGSWVWGALLVAGFAVSVRTLVEGKIGANTAAWTRVIQGHSQDRRHGKRQRCVPAGLDMACGALGSDATRRSSSQSSCSFRNANFDLPIC
jgi:hypothetical protein